MKNIWTNYRVQWLFFDNLCGSVPGDPKLWDAWIAARQPTVRPPGGRSISDIQEEVFETIALGEEEPKRSVLVFQRVDGALVMRSATIRAHLMKDCARQVSSLYVGKIKGERSFATRVINGVYTDEREYWTPILRPEGDPVREADGTKDKPVHAKGPRGEPINALKTYEYVNPARMDFTLKVLGNCVSQDDLETLMQYGGVHGYAGERGDGEGKYTFTLEPVK